MIENEVTGRKYRILTNKEEDEWDRISFWTSASDVYYSGDTGNAEENRPINIIQRNYTYQKDDVVYVPSAKSWAMFVCTKSGQTANILPSAYKEASVGDVVEDGSTFFRLYDIRPTSTASDSPYQIPSMNLVNDINNKLTAPDGTKFYFDYQNGYYGYNTDPAKGSGSFHPFGGLTVLESSWSKAGEGTIDCSKVPGCESFTNSNFLVIPHLNGTHNSYQKTHTKTLTTDQGSADGNAYFYYYYSYDQNTKLLTLRCALRANVTIPNDNTGGVTMAIPCTVAVLINGEI
jgi:hypothetical protein